MAATEPPRVNRVDRAVGVVLVAGPPGSGKGTQCELLAQAQGWGHLSSGEVFRDEIARQTPLGQRLDELIGAGQLVPDDLTVEVVLGALETWTIENPTVENVLLDGFPRTLPQARALLGRASRYVVRLVIELVVPPSVSFDRLALRSRSDDDTAAIRLRLALYESQTRPALDWLAELGLLVTVDGDQPPEAVGTAIRCRLAAIGASPRRSRRPSSAFARLRRRPESAASTPPRRARRAGATREKVSPRPPDQLAEQRRQHDMRADEQPQHGPLQPQGRDDRQRDDAHATFVLSGDQWPIARNSPTKGRPRATLASVEGSAPTRTNTIATHAP